VAFGNRSNGSGKRASRGKKQNKQKGAVHMVVEAPAASSSSGRVFAVDGQRKGKGKIHHKARKERAMGKGNRV